MKFVSLTKKYLIQNGRFNYKKLFLIPNGGSNVKKSFLLFQNGMYILLTFLNRHHPFLKVVIAIVQSHYKIFRDDTKRINIKKKFVSITKNFNPKGQFQLQKTLFLSQMVGQMSKKLFYYFRMEWIFY